MLPAPNRLKLNNKKYRRIRNGGSVLQTREIKLIVWKTGDNRPTRLAFVVPKKLAKRATKRNRTRRLLSTAVYRLLPQILRGYELVVIAKKIFDKQKLNKAEAQMRAVLSKGGLLRK